MDKVKQLADELYNQKVLDGWKNVSMETCLKRATDYYRMDEVVKKLTIPVVVQQSGLLFCDCYIKYPRGKGNCYKCGLSERP